MKNILIVDDVKGWRDFNTNVMHELFGEDINIDTAESGKEALKMVSDNKYDVILLIYAKLSLLHCLPSTIISPLFGRSKPNIALMIVDFPLPEGPYKTYLSPLLILKDKLLINNLSLYMKLQLLNEIIFS